MCFTRTLRLNSRVVMLGKFKVLVKIRIVLLSSINWQGYTDSSLVCPSPFSFFQTRAISSRTHIFFFKSLTQEKPTHNLQKFVRLLKLRQMARFCKSNPFHFLNRLEERFHNTILCFIVFPIDEQSRGDDFMDWVYNGPSFQSAWYEKLWGAVPFICSVTIVG